MTIFFKEQIKKLLGLQYRVACYAQEGEDIILDKLLSGQQYGFYVDIGAHHPKRFSNTYLFYKRGWYGINIDAMPGSMANFNRVRPRDINLEAGISVENGKKQFFIFSEGALNTFDAELAQQRISSGWELERTAEIHLRTINSVLEEYLPTRTQIDLLTIDIEGLDDVVLSTFDFTRFRPKIIVCEALEKNIEDVLSSKLASILKKEGYSLFSKLYHSCIWKSMK